MVDTSVSLAGVRLDNSIIPASGTFGFGYEFAEIYDINCLGSISIKGTTREPRFGNPTPRIAECASGLLNSVGLQNPGIDRVIAEELPRLRKCFKKPIIANISGFSLDEYVECCERMDKEEQVEIPLLVLPYLYHVHRFLPPPVGRGLTGQRAGSGSAAWTAPAVR